jgi:hypothetical protein
MHVMLSHLVPFTLRQSAFRNETGPSGPVESFIAGLIYTPGCPLQLIVGKDTHRFYDIPLRFAGQRGGLQYTVPPTHEDPTFAHEPRPRRVTAYLLPWAPKQVGTCHGTLTWNYFNTSLLLVVLDTGEVLFWPPHKVEWTDKPKGLPAWLKRRYADDMPTLAKTRVFEAENSEMMEMTSIAERALRLPPSDWRAHGLGLIQTYMAGNEDPKQYRVHVWTPDAMLVGLEAGIHNHRYDLRSVLVAGVLTQEEWTAQSDIEGLWHAWRHDNETMEPVLTTDRYSLSPRTLDIRCGQGYTFPRDGFHRSVPRSDVAITVMQRFNVEGNSYALCPTGVTPTNGQTARGIDVGATLALARKHMGLRG